MEQRVVVLPEAHDQHPVVHGARVAHELEGMAEAQADGAVQQPVLNLGLLLADLHAATC